MIGQCIRQHVPTFGNLQGLTCMDSAVSFIEKRSSAFTDHTLALSRVHLLAFESQIGWP